MLDCVATVELRSGVTDIRDQICWLAFFLLSPRSIQQSGTAVKHRGESSCAHQTRQAPVLTLTLRIKPLLFQHIGNSKAMPRNPGNLAQSLSTSAYDTEQWQLFQRHGMHGSLLGALQSLFDGCSLFMGVGEACRCTHNPSTGLRPGCPLSATILQSLATAYTKFTDSVPRPWRPVMLYLFERSGLC